MEYSSGREQDRYARRKTGELSLMEEQTQGCRTARELVKVLVGDVGR